MRKGTNSAAKSTSDQFGPSTFIIRRVFRHPRPPGSAGVRRRSRRGDRAGAGGGVETILCPAVSADSSQAVLQLAEEFDLPAAVGIHPNSTAEAAADDWQRVARLGGHPRVVALGETGLDRYWDFSPLHAAARVPRSPSAVGPGARPAGDSPLPRRGRRIDADAPRGRRPRAAPRRAARL